MLLWRESNGLDPCVWSIRWFIFRRFKDDYTPFWGIWLRVDLFKLISFFVEPSRPLAFVDSLSLCRKDLEIYTRSGPCDPRYAQVCLRIAARKSDAVRNCRTAGILLRL